MVNGSKDLMKTFQIRIWGVVQGVGFRPFVHRIAKAHDLRGFVSNNGACVLIVIQADDKQLDNFLHDLENKKPQSSEIIRMDVSEMDCGNFDSRSPLNKCFVSIGGAICDHDSCFDQFKIGPSTDACDNQVFISPDLAVCDKCMEDLFNGDNRRYLHPFVSCMECGPRYSIIECVPYDRENTTMFDFFMCNSCLEEYTSIGDRRYHAQTISCHQCGPQLKFRQSVRDKEVTGAEAFEASVEMLKAGKVLAVKGIGGFHLCASAFDTNAVEALRQLKGREEKPFAVMFDDLSEIDKYCYVSEEERELLVSREKPIVLLKRKESDISASVYKSSRYLGCFLAYTPLHKMLISSCGPLVMTSANVSGEPIIIDEERVMTLDGSILSGVLYNERRILTGIDDSVIKVSRGKGIQFIRRARGFVPLPLYLGDEVKNAGSVLACGSDLKNTFCLTQNGYAYLSQYGGDLEEVGNYVTYKQNIERLKKLLRINPETVCCDLHPQYQSSKFAREMGIRVLEVQHHYAHILSVMAENNLQKQIIGVAFDGTGYGTDGNMWGGEFLVASTDGFIRAGHLMYVPLLGGDSSVKEAWKTAYSYLYSSGLEAYIKDERWPVIKAALEHKVNMVLSSSMGRLFDAVSSLAGIKDYSEFEGECAILLENYAADYMCLNNLQDIFENIEFDGAYSWYKPYKYDIIHNNGVLVGDMKRCIGEIVSESRKGTDKATIAWRFHITVIDYVVKMCTKLRSLYKIDEVALGGGVFQNSVIFEGVVSMLTNKGFKVYFNTKVPVNDGGISLGQAYAAMLSDS